MPLNDTFLKNLKPAEKPQKHSDGGGLFIYVAPTGGKLWRMAYRFGGKQKLLSLGAYPAVSLKDARQKRDEAKELLAAGVDPGQHKKEVKKAAIKAEMEASSTFEAVALEWFAKYSPTLTNKHANKLDRYLTTIIFPEIGSKPVSELEPADVLKVVQPAESKGHITTAHKLMYLTSQVLNYAQLVGKTKYNIASGLRGALRPIKSESLAALTDPKAIGQLLRDIDACDGHPSIAFFLKVLPYVFTRPSELRLAQWAEINFDDALWRIPANRMKMRRGHVVPLSRQVVDLLESLHLFSGTGSYLFPSLRVKVRTISDAGPLAALRRLGYTQEQMCLHGFRAMASTRLNELGYKPDVIEACLAHKDPDAVRLAYNRAEYLDERRKLMQEWADYLDELRAIR